MPAARSMTHLIDFSDRLRINVTACSARERYGQRRKGTTYTWNVYQGRHGDRSELQGIPLAVGRPARKREPSRNPCPRALCRKVVHHCIPDWNLHLLSPPPISY